MVKRTEERIDTNEEKIFKTWADSYIAVSKMWEDSCEKLYRPWIKSTGEMLEKTASITKEATPQKYREFYDEWIKTYQNTFGKFYPIPTPQSNKKTLETFLSGAEESNKLYRSWITELEENSRKTREILKSQPDAGKYKECYEMWIRSYEKIFDELMELADMESTKEIYKNYLGIPEIYSVSFLQMSKIWKKSYARLYMPMNESMLKLSEKMAEISRGDSSPEAYKEFYSLWMDTYKEIYDKYVMSMETSGDMFESFTKSTEIYLGMYKSWISALEQMSEKAREISVQISDPEAYIEFSNLWVRMYEKAFEGFFEDMPIVEGPMKQVIEPVKIMAKMYADTFIRFSKMWVRGGVSSASAYPGKYKK